MGCTATVPDHQPRLKNKSGIGQATKPPPLPTIKEIAEAQLKKYTPMDIFKFIKFGNLDMIHGLITYHNLKESVMDLRLVGGIFKPTK